MGLPLIRFAHKTQRVKNRERIYENEIRITYCEGYESYIGFDQKTGGECQKIMDDSRWDLDLNLNLVCDDDSSDGDWTLI